jgi:hypothetical protein
MAMQTRASEIRGSRIEAKENIFPSVSSRDFRFNYQNALDFLTVGFKNFDRWVLPPINRGGRRRGWSAATFIPFSFRIGD